MLSNIFSMIETIGVSAAKALANSVIHCTEGDGKPDIVVAVLSVDGRILCLEKSGDYPLLISDKWAIKKAISAISFGTSTLMLYDKKSKLNVGDEYCNQPGGILIPSSKWSGWLKDSFEIIPEDGVMTSFCGALGVSGRTSLEDHILAVEGLKDFVKMNQS